MSNTITITTEEYKHLVSLEGKIKAVEAYYKNEDFADEDIMAVMLGIEKKVKKTSAEKMAEKKELDIPAFMLEKK